jgi:hypothetical protein
MIEVPRLRIAEGRPAFMQGIETFIQKCYET